MIRLIYNLLWPIGLLLFLPSYLVKMFRRGGYRKGFGQRLGFYSSEWRRRLHGKSPTWIHAVSVGEVVIALKLAEQLRALRPNLNCVLTTTTTTGHSLAQKSAPNWMEVLYAPRVSRYCPASYRSDRSRSVAQPGGRSDALENSNRIGECAPISKVRTKVSALQGSCQAHFSTA
jgi:hypothetical protein